MLGDQGQGQPSFSSLVGAVFTGSGSGMQEMSGEDDNKDVEERAKEIAEKIVTGTPGASLVALVEGMGTQLTDTVVQERMKAVDFLARVLSFLPASFLSEKELEFLVDFLINRLKDQHLVVPKAISCCYPVVQCQNLPKGDGARLLHQIFQETNIQSHMQRTRQTVFLIIDFLLQNKLEELQGLSSDFVINFLQAMDGEKDPRNLLLLFQIVPCVMNNFNLGPFAEDFFEILSCYFPIDFSLTINIGGSIITREMLSSALETCLSQTNLFSSFLIPLSLEKLDSSIVDAKLDALRLLKACCDRCYEPESLKPYLAQLWHSLRREIFMGGSDVVENECISFLQSAFMVVSQDEGVFQTCIDLIFIECKHHLCEPELRLIRPSSRIILAMCNASEVACNAVAPRVITVLHDQLVQNSVQMERRRLMQITEEIIVSCRQYPEVCLSQQLANWDEVLATWFSFITSSDPEFTNLSLMIMFRVLVNENDFSKKDRHLLTLHLLTLLKSPSLSKAIVNIVVKICEEFVKKHGSEFGSTFLPPLLECIEEPEPEPEKVDGLQKSLCTKVTAECCVYNETVFQQVLISLFDKNYETPFHLGSGALNCLNRIVGKINQLEDSKTVSVLSKILVEERKLFHKVFEYALQISKPQHGCENSGGVNIEDIFNICLNILRKLMRSSPEIVQRQLVDYAWNQRVSDTSWEQCLPNFPFPLIDSVIGSLRPKVKFHRQKEFQTHLLKVSLNATENFSLAESHQRLLAVIVNKLDDEIEFRAFLNEIEFRINVCLEDNSEEEMEVAGLDSSVPCIREFKVEDMSKNMPTTKQSCATSLLAWITKGLAMRGLADLSYWVDKLINLLSRDDTGNMAAVGFEVLLSEDESLNAKSHCSFRFLYKQRLFQMSVPKLVVRYGSSTSATAKANHIKALSCQLKHIPQEILAMEIESVFPLLVASLKLDASPALVHSTLKAFTEMIQNSNDETDRKLAEYCFDVIPQLIKLSKFTESMEVRIMALKSLYKCSRCPSHCILPLRQEVIENLGKCLDDPKRLVRSAARKSRNIWLLVGSPGGL